MCAGEETNSPRIPLPSVLPPNDLLQISHIHITVLHQVQLVILVVVGIAQGVTLGIVLGIGEVVVVVPLSGREGVLVDVVSEEVDGAARQGKASAKGGKKLHGLVCVDIGLRYGWRGRGLTSFRCS